MADAPEVTLEGVAAALVELGDKIKALPTNDDLGAIKSGFQSNFDTLRSDVDELAKGSTKSFSTEKGAKDAGVAERRSAEQIEAARKQELAERDEFWKARNAAIYDKKLPESLFEGVTAASEIKRLTALADHLGGGNKSDNKDGAEGSEEKSERAGGGGNPPPAGTKLSPLESIAAGLKGTPSSK